MQVAVGDVLTSSGTVGSVSSLSPRSLLELLRLLATCFQICVDIDMKADIFTSG